MLHIHLRAAGANDERRQAWDRVDGLLRALAQDKVGGETQTARQAITPGCTALGKHLFKYVEGAGWASHFVSHDRRRSLRLKNIGLGKHSTNETGEETLRKGRQLQSPPNPKTRLELPPNTCVENLTSATTVPPLIVPPVGV